jgi:hypothetical protein
MHTRTLHRVGRLIILASELDKPRTDSLSTRARTCTTTSLYTTIHYDNPSAVVSTAWHSINQFEPIVILRAIDLGVPVQPGDRIESHR